MFDVSYAKFPPTESAIASDFFEQLQQIKG